MRAVRNKAQQFVELAGGYHIQIVTCLAFDFELTLHQYPLE